MSGKCRVSRVMGFLFFLLSLFFFSPIPIHYLLFVVVSFVFLRWILEGRVAVGRYHILFIVVYIFSLGFALSSHIYNIDNSSWEHLAKYLCVTFLFLEIIIMASGGGRSTNVSASNDLYIFDLRALKKVYFIIIFLNFAQALYSVYILDIWGLPFSSEKNSVSAYAIEASTIYFGSPNKNIWASKLVMYCLPLFYFFYVSSVEKKWWFGFGYMASIFFMLFFVILYTQSRVAQVCFLVASFPFFLLFVFSINIKALRWFILLFLIFVFFVFSYIYFSKFFYIQFDYGDGFFSRVLLWKLALTLIPESPFLGYGFESGAVFINTIGLPAQNFHNVIVNSAMDFGLLGGSFIILFWLLGIFSSLNSSMIYFVPRVVTLVVMFSIFSVQYYGYDPELIFVLLPLLKARVPLSRSN